MMIQAKYVHTNLVAEDWRSLVAFYQQVFGCVIVPPEWRFRAEDLEASSLQPVLERIRQGPPRLS